MSTLVAPLTDAEVEALGEGRVIVRDGVLAPELVRACVDGLAARASALSPAGVGRERRLDRAIRGDAIGWLGDDDAPATLALRRLFESVRVAVSEGCWIGLARYTVQVARFPGDGTGYARHRDALAGSVNRRVTAILYLNEAWRPEDGGALRVWEGEGVRDVEPVAGRLVCFLSDRVEHEVLPSFRERWAVTAWYRGAEAIPTVDDPG